MRHSRSQHFLLILTFLFVSCSSQLEPHAPVSSKVDWNSIQVTSQPNGSLCINEKNFSWDQVKQDFTYGLLGAIYSDNTAGTREIADGTFITSTNVSQTFSLHLWYPEGNARSVSLRIFILLDDKQLNNIFAKDGYYYDVILDRGSDTKIPLKVPYLESGIHDLIAVAVPYLEDYPVPEGLVNLVYWRATIVVNSPSSPFRDIEFISLAAEGLNSKGDPSMVVELMLKKDKFIVWNWPNPWLDVKTKDPVNFYALAGYKYVDNITAPSLGELKASFFSLLLFVDFQQIEIAPDQTVIYGKVDKDTAYTRIPITIEQLPEGKHLLLALRVDSPGVPMCILRGDPNGRILPSSVDGKLVGINVLSR